MSTCPTPETDTGKREKKRDRLRILAGGIALIIVCALSLFSGAGAVTAGELFSALGKGGGTAALILWRIRMPRVAAGILCGASLSVSGMLLQSSLGNDLCSPGVIGINAGAGFFALLAAAAVPGQALLQGTAAFLGALAAAMLVLVISRKAGASRTGTVLAGVAVSSLMTAGINVIVTIRPDTVTDKVAFSLGGLSAINMKQLMISGVFCVPALAAALVMAGGIELFALGDETAEGVGLPVRTLRTCSIVCAAVLAACAVSLCGLLGFIGLIVPNLLRMTGVRGSRMQFVLCMLFGSAFLILCDMISRHLFYPYELPVGVVLSCLGAPFFIFVLLRRKKRRSGADS